MPDSPTEGVARPLILGIAGRLSARRPAYLKINGVGVGQIQERNHMRRPHSA
jgi:hypothetical protein